MSCRRPCGTSTRSSGGSSRCSRRTTVSIRPAACPAGRQAGVLRGEPVVLLWGYDEDQGWRADPPVYQGVNNEEVEWYLEAVRLSGFLAGMNYWQALFGGLAELRSGNAPESIRQAAASWPLVWQDESTQLFSHGPVVFSLTSRDGCVEVQAAGVSEADLVTLWRALGL